MFYTKFREVTRQHLEPFLQYSASFHAETCVLLAEPDLESKKLGRILRLAFSIMPITELTLPAPKQDEDTRIRFVSSVRPLLATTINSASGLKGQYLGKVILENDVNVEVVVKYALGLGTSSIPMFYRLTYCPIEWARAQSFHDFIGSEEFGVFKNYVKPFPPPQSQKFMKRIQVQ
jgi:hypothetical protein